MEMAQYIISIFKYYLPIVWSWGFENPVAIKDGLQFKVNGFKHQGKVRVIYNGGNDLFDIVLLDRTGKKTRREEGVYLDCLVNVIDGLVEKTDDYESRVNAEYGWN